MIALQTSAKIKYFLDFNHEHHLHDFCHSLKAIVALLTF